MLISSEMSSLKLGSCTLSTTLNFHICTHLKLKTKPGCGNCLTPHPPQFRWSVPSSMKLMWTENNRVGRGFAWLVFYNNPLYVKNLVSTILVIITDTHYTLSAVVMHLPIFIQFFELSHKIRCYTVFIIQMENQRPRNFNWLSQGLRKANRKCH